MWTTCIHCHLNVTLNWCVNVCMQSVGGMTLQHYDAWEVEGDCMHMYKRMAFFKDDFSCVLLQSQVYIWDMWWRTTSFLSWCTHAIVVGRGVLVRMNWIPIRDLPKNGLRSSRMTQIKMLENEKDSSMVMWWLTTLCEYFDRLVGRLWNVDPWWPKHPKIGFSILNDLTRKQVFLTKN